MSRCYSPSWRRERAPRRSMMGLELRASDRTGWTLNPFNIVCRSIKFPLNLSVAYKWRRRLPLGHSAALGRSDLGCPRALRGWKIGIEALRLKSSGLGIPFHEFQMSLWSWIRCQLPLPRREIALFKAMRPWRTLRNSRRREEAERYVRRRAT